MDFKKLTNELAISIQSVAKNLNDWIECHPDYIPATWSGVTPSADIKESWKKIIADMMEEFEFNQDEAKALLVAIAGMDADFLNNL